MEKDEAKLAFFDLKYENQNTDVGYERDQRFSGLKPQNAYIRLGCITENFFAIFCLYRDLT